MIINHNTKVTIKLLTLPMFWMAAAQIIFGLLSAFFFRDKIAKDFFYPSIIELAIATLLLAMLHKTKLVQISYKAALFFSTSTWIIMGILGALPIINVTDISFTDAFFESISGLTTTGATVLSGLDSMPRSFLLYRQFLQWMGGLGIVIFVVAVLPMLNIGGMRLLKAETPGPIKDDKLSPRITSTSRYLWIVYIVITFLCALFYYLAGMSAFDAIAHSFSTVSTGGFSTYDASMNHFNSHLILFIANIFMVLGAINFAIHFKVFQRFNLKTYWQDEETRAFILIIVTIALIITLYLLFNHHYDTIWESLSYSTFMVISFITSTGFGVSDYANWPITAAVILVFTSYLGGCAGSTAGGNKIIRNVISVKVLHNSIKQLVHPDAMFIVKYQGKRIENSVAYAVMSFMALTTICSIILTMLLTATGLDFWSALSAVAACVNVNGPGFNVVGSNFQPVSDVGTWILSVSMILGRLEYFTVLSLFTVAFWRT